MTDPVVFGLPSEDMSTEARNAKEMFEELERNKERLTKQAKLLKEALEIGGLPAPLAFLCNDFITDVEFIYGDGLNPQRPLGVLGQEG